MLQLRSLHYLTALASRLNFARAADDLGISQSALSRSIQNLEQELGLRLFDRDRSGVALTPQGKFAVERAAVLLADAEHLERQLTLSANADAGRVRFGMSPMPAHILLPALIAARLSEAPTVINEVVVRDGNALWSLLVAGDIEFFVVNEGFHFDLPPPRIEALGQFPISLIVRAGHPLLVAPHRSAKFPVVRSSWTGLPLPAGLQDRILSVNVIEDFGSLAAVTAASDAIWFTSPYAVSAELQAGRLCELPSGEAPPRREVQMLMYTLERRSQSPWTRSLKHLLRQQIKLLQEANP